MLFFSSKNARVTGVFSLAACLYASHPASAQTYTITDLGVLSGTRFSIPHAVNAGGATVGSSEFQNSVGHAVLWQNSTITNLEPAGSLSSDANGINTVGQIVGGVEDSSGITHAYLWQNKQPINLGFVGSAYAVNYAGAIVGDAADANSQGHAFIWTPTTANGTTGTLGYITSGNGGARGVNHFYQVAGYYHIGQFNHAFLWDKQHGLLDLGGIGTTDSNATGVNYDGIVIGDFIKQEGVNTYYHAFVWKPTTPNGTVGTSTDLGRGQAMGINHAGQIVGTNTLAALLWQNGTVKDLNTAIPAGSGWTLYEADAINDNGQIVGAGSLNGSMDHAFLLTPH